MSRFDNVSIELKANFYFDAKVTSRTVHFPDGSRKTLGIIMPGEYEFGTEAAEIMAITQGKARYQLAGDEAWQSVSAGEEFHVPANSAFKIAVEEVVDYCCSYITT